MNIYKVFIYFCLFCIITLVINAFFIYPSADDFSYYTGVQEKGFWEFQKWHYMNWGGRYIPNALLGAFNFEGIGLWIYRSIAILMVLGLFSAFTLFIKNVLKIKGKDVLPIACIIFLGYTLSLYSISQQFYWWAGSFTYTFGIIICLIIWSFWDRVYSWRYFLLMLFLVFVLNGTNEIGILMFNFSLVLWGIYQYIQKGKISNFQYGLILFSMIFGAFSILAPGNTERSLMMGFENTKSLSHSLPRTINRSMILLWEHLYNIIFIIIALFPFLSKIPTLKIEIPEKWRKIFAISLFIFPFAILCLGVFPSYWATGRIPPQRTVNTVSFFFMIAMIFSLLLYISNFTLKNKVLTSFKEKHIGIGLILGAFLLFPNYLKTSVIELFSGKSYHFSQQMQERIKYIKTTSEEDVIIKEIETPSIMFGELTEDKNHYYNKAYAKFYNKRSIIIRKK